MRTKLTLFICSVLLFGCTEYKTLKTITTKRLMVGYRVSKHSSICVKIDSQVIRIGSLGGRRIPYKEVNDSILVTQVIRSADEDTFAYFTIPESEYHYISGISKTVGHCW